MSYNRKKNAHKDLFIKIVKLLLFWFNFLTGSPYLEPPRDILIRFNKLGRVLNPVDVNFHLQKSLEIFDKNSAAKNLIQKGQGVESAPSHANYG